MELTVDECLTLMDGHHPPPVTQVKQFKGYWAVFERRLYATYAKRDADSVLLLAGGLPEPWDTSWHELALLNTREQHQRSTPKQKGRPGP